MEQMEQALLDQDRQEAVELSPRLFCSFAKKMRASFLVVLLKKTLRVKIE